jgi:PAS domain S-box-containing protein
MAGCRPQRFLATLFLALVLLIDGPVKPLWAKNHPVGEPFHVLVLHSFHPELARTEGIMDGLYAGLAGVPVEIKLHVQYMDTKRFSDRDYLTHILDAILHYKLARTSFDLALVVDDPALNFAVEHRDSLFANTPLIFCGISNYRPEMMAGLDGVTGVVEYPAFRETLGTALRLHAGSEEVVVIGGIRDLSDRENRRMLLAAMSALPEQVRFTFWDDLPLDELEVRLAALPPGRLAFLNGAVYGQNGEVLTFSEALGRLTRAGKVPIYSVWDFLLGEGIVGGKLVNGGRQGRIAAELARRVLAGKRPEEIPVVVAESSEYLFDYRQLQKWSISTRSLPSGSHIVNQPPPFALSRRQLAFGFGLVSLLAVFLLLDIVWRRRTERELRASEERVRLLLDSAAEGICGLDIEGRCTFCNPAALRLLGYRQEGELLGSNIHEMIHHTRPDGSPYPREDCRVCRVFDNAEGLHVEDEVLWRSDGSSFPAEYWSYPMHKGGRLIGAVVSLLNIAERKEAERKLSAANRELDAFVYTVSHDLRNPLTAVIGYADHLRVAEVPHQQQREFLGEIVRQGRRMLALMEDLLALARVGALERPAEPVAVEGIVEEVLKELGSSLHAAGLVVEKGELPALRVPESLLAQIFGNLLGNAFRYAGPDGGPIEVGGEREGRQVRFFVRDHGTGILAAERERIFQVFCRGTASKGVDGTGVGLATVQKITRLYGGRAWVEETPGGGATFRVELEDAETA